MKQLRLILLFSLFCTIWAALSGSDSVPSADLLGIAPGDESYYKALSSSGAIKCKDGSKKFTKSQLNDNFCDCPDGTDEPGTSACPNGKFYCRNAGHAPLSIFSSRVNDGICDCCDGSDEYDGIVKCSNTCWEAGKVARDKLKKKIVTYQEGVTLRKQEIEQAKLAVAKDEAELSKLKNEEKILKGLVQQLKEHKENIEKAEEKERLQKEKEEKEKKEAEEAQRVQSKDVEEVSSQGEPLESTSDNHIGLLEDSPSDEVYSIDPVHELESADSSGNDDLPRNDVQEGAAKKEEDSSVATESAPDIEEKDASENAEALSKEELGRLVASRWTGEVDAGKDDKHEISEDTSDAHNDEYEGYDSDSEDASQKYNEDEEEEDEEDHVEEFEEEKHDDFSSPDKSTSDDELDLQDTTTSSSPSWLEKIQQTVRNILQAVNLFQTPVDISEAARVRKEYDESSSKLSKIQSRISSLTKKLNQDFGPEKEFYSFYSKCFEIRENKYIYKICPFKQASQEEGHSTTRLGNWDKFEDSYKAMVFSSGDKCWNGPDRSLKVRLRCGLKNEATDVDEPSRCEYEALLSTPILCLEEKLKELQEKLDLMNKQQPQGHDEL